MERKDYQSIGDVLREALRENDMQGHIDGLKAAETWRHILGEHLADQCGRPFVRDGVMTVKVASAALRNELHMHRSKLADAINRQLGKQVISSIRLL